MEEHAIKTAQKVEEKKTNKHAFHMTATLIVQASRSKYIDNFIRHDSFTKMRLNIFCKVKKKKEKKKKKRKRKKCEPTEGVICNPCAYCIVCYLATEGKT